VKAMVTSVTQLGKSSRLVPGCVSITHKKDLLKHLCVGDFDGNQGVNQTQRVD
jgi:hypothetical protein